MKTGKLIGIILSVIVVLLIAYVLFSGESANVPNEQILQPQETSQNQITQNDSNYQTNEDLEKIKALLHDAKVRINKGKIKKSDIDLSINIEIENQ